MKSDSLSMTRVSFCLEDDSEKLSRVNGWGGGGGLGRQRIHGCRRSSYNKLKQTEAWSACGESTNKVVPFDDVPLVECVYFAVTRMPRKSYRKRLTYLLLCSWDVFRALINFLVC